LSYAVAVTLSYAVAVTLSYALAVTLSYAVAVTLSYAVAVTLSYAVAVTLSYAVAVTLSYAVAVTLSYAVAVTLSYAVAVTLSYAVAVTLSYAVAVTLSYAVADSDKVNFKKICVVIERLDKLFFLVAFERSNSKLQCRPNITWLQTSHDASNRAYLEYIGIYHTLQLQGLCTQTAATMCHVYPFYLSAFACNATWLLW